MKKALNIYILLLLASCSLAENVKKEEKKDYQDTVHDVERVDYEFEERLNSFYESEPIKNEELVTLYEGEFPEGERNPQKLRIHWRDARELAMAELELQKSIQTGWNNATISERPILVLDKDGGDFYRYYEYRVVEDKKYLGAIRIPAYRRTENFATAEVHVYSADEKTYTVYPTGWSIALAQNMKFNEESSFMQSIQNQIDENITDNLALAYGVNMIKSSPDLMPNKTISDSTISSMFSRDVNALVDSDPWVAEMQDRMRGNGEVIAPAKENFIQQNNEKIGQELANSFNIMTLYNMAQSVIPESKQMLKYMGTVKYLEIYLSVLQNNFLYLALNEKKTTLDRKMVSFFWDNLEERITSKNIAEINDFWNYDTLFDNYKITPKLNYFSSKVERHISAQELSKNLTPSLELYLAQDNVKIEITSSPRFRMARSAIPDFNTREEAIAFLDNEIKKKLQQSADSVNDATAVSMKILEEGMNVLFPSGKPAGEPKPPVYQLGKPVPNMGSSIITASLSSGAITEGSLVTASAFISTLSTALIASGGALIGAATIGLAIYAGVVLTDHFSNKAKEEREKQFNQFDEEIMSNDKGLGSIIANITKQFEDKGWSPLSSDDGENIDFILTYRSTSSEEERKRLFNKRLYREMAIRCNRWWLKKSVNGNYIHSSWDTGMFVPIPEEFIVNNGGYCHIKGDISNNPTY